MRGENERILNGRNLALARMTGSVAGTILCPMKAGIASIATKFYINFK